MACALASNAAAVFPTTKSSADEITRPDISWIPSYKVFRDRVETLKTLYPDRTKTVPKG